VEAFTGIIVTHINTPIIIFFSFIFRIRFSWGLNLKFFQKLEKFISYTIKLGSHPSHSTGPEAPQLFWSAVAKLPLFFRHA
jgi:hypothetical protein